MTKHAALSFVAAFSLLLGACVVDNDPVLDGGSSPDTASTGGGEPDLTQDEIERSGFSKADRVACLARGGTYERRGMLGRYSCAEAYADAGKECRKASDCEGQCRVEDGDRDPPVGQCQANTDSFGCYSYLTEDGEVVGICVD